MAFERFEADRPYAPSPTPEGFSVDLAVFSGPFDALLSMIAERRVDLTEVALSQVTDEFLSYVRGLDLGGERNMDAASAFLDVAAVLVEAKSAALLPGDEHGERDERSMEALRERDLLFARLVQYRAFKQAAMAFRERDDARAGVFAHPGGVDDSYAAMAPQLVWTMSPEGLAALAAAVLANAPVDRVAVSQLHVPPVDFHAQARIVVGRLQRLGPGESTTFADLTGDARENVEVAARFLAVLVLFKQGSIQFKQRAPFEVLHLRWIAGVGEPEDIGEEEFL
ncbi:segregation and condensation protein A [Bifidobacterium mongoliense]|uniref:segregation and condensation protein A n=1 Tax=Bifidobacterium mongoliense TaxID=518643 RepID=UPI0026493AAE|nr:ScpA family protein [Bifidobacterium mongoliense]MDN5633045.1 segregation/condensation protein A [Bifidobacterium mongoliense]MDN6769240.1 segregation/condensation protein A [Bifidobacterium mongoliense]MDN6783294.1 segregation/condensation protein A [Bifidobacterium mongoliense]MDN6803221.1 segregation/condensation protein A [Bifidobacterium mongoliense]